MLKTLILFACLALPTTAFADGSAKPPAPKKDPPPPAPPKQEAPKTPPKKNGDEVGVKPSGDAKKPKPNDYMSQENATSKSPPKPTDKKK